jgi:hypothetical protein
MGSSLHPDADYSQIDAGDWQDCDDSAGTGEDESMCECELTVDICLCAQPTPIRCEICDGDGGWEIDHSAEDQAAYEAERDTQ